MEDKTTKTAPERIWLQVDTGAHPDEYGEPFPADTQEVTWSADSIGGVEVAYVRADIARRDSAHSGAYAWLAPRLIAADFAWGDEKESVLIFRWPTGVAVSASLRDCVERAKLAEIFSKRPNTPKSADAESVPLD